MTEDGSFRVVAIDATDTAASILAVQNARSDETQIFAELVLTAVLYRETMAPDLRVQGLLHGIDGECRMAIDSHPDGSTRGLITRKNPDASILLGIGASLDLLRTLPNGKGFRGVVALDQTASVAQAFMEFMQSSEQIVSMIALATVLEGPKVLRAMGYLIQLTPETLAAPLALLTARLPEFESITERAKNLSYTPAQLIHDLLEGLPYGVTTERPVKYQCQCSAARVFASLTTLPRKDIEELVAAKEPVELVCDYCTTTYRMGPAELRGLLQKS